jgi:hypothetical protein
MSLKNRIIAHRRVRASDLVPHHLNPRTHGDAQRGALRGLLEEIGLARSVLAYVSDEDKKAGLDRLTLIDGHLRSEELGDEEVDVEVLDVNDAEARALLLSLDPLAALAGFDTPVLERLRATTKTEHDALANLWASIDAANQEVEQNLEKARNSPKKKQELPELFQVLITCKNEQDQVALLRRLKREGLDCKALTV